jgi:hypothetical protein
MIVAIRAVPLQRTGPEKTYSYSTGPVFLSTEFAGKTAGFDSKPLNLPGLLLIL